MSSSESRDIGTWIAVGGLLVLAVGLLGLMVMVAPHLLGVILIVGGFLSFGAVHYVLWGWWLGGSLHPREEDDAERDR